MKILSLRVEQFKKFDQPVLVDGFDDGVNLIAGPNETGKSTLLLALRAALFERHGAKTQAVKDFSPHHVTGARPTVTLAFEIGGERYLLEKSFLKRPAATLRTSAGQRFEGADAETELKRLLHLDPSEKTSVGKDSPLHFGVLLTPQTRSFEQPRVNDDTRHTLEAAIAGDIAELGHQGEVDALLATFRTEQARLVNGHGKKQGRYKEVAERLAAIEREIGETSAQRDTLRDHFEQLERAIAERSALQAAEISEGLSDRLASLEGTRAEAARRQALENRRLAASQRLQAAEAKRAARQARLEERRRITDEIEAIGKAADDAKRRLSTIDETLSARDRTLADLGERLRISVRRRSDLERLGRDLERLRQVEATLAALATDVRLDLEADALDKVTVNDEPATATGERLQVTQGLSIEIRGIGRIGIEPKIEPMKEALAAKTGIETEIGQLLAVLDLKDGEREIIESAWQSIAAEIERLETSRAETESAGAGDRRAAAEAKAAIDACSDRRTRLARRLAEIDAAGAAEAEDEGALDIEITEARGAFEAADSAFQAGPPSRGPDAMSLDAEIAALRGRIDERRRALDAAGKKVLTLEAAIGALAGLGLDEKIDQLDRQRHLLAKERDAFALDHQALSLLQSTLRDAADEAKATFNAPLSARLAPYIQELFPGATPIVTPDFSIRAVDRQGVEEPFLHLSDGTREQIAVLARLAFADMLQEQGLPALIVLDDALAFSDARRLERMAAILEKAGERMQIIVLACHEHRFAGLGGKHLKIAPAADQRPTAA